MTGAETAIAGSIASDLWTSYGLDAAGAVPVEGGWLNRKWKLQGPRGPVLVKQYSVERFGPQQLDEVEASLGRQLLLEEAGIPCPHIWKAGDSILRRLDDATCYMVMDFSPGRQESWETVTTGQLYSLGVICGRMQQALEAMPVQGARGYPPLGGRRIWDGLWAFHESYQGEQGGPQALSRAMAAQKSILESLDPAFLTGCPWGCPMRTLRRTICFLMTMAWRRSLILTVTSMAICGMTWGGRCCPLPWKRAGWRWKRPAPSWKAMPRRRRHRAGRRAAPCLVPGIPLVDAAEAVRPCIPEGRAVPG